MRSIFVLALVWSFSALSWAQIPENTSQQGLDAFRQLYQTELGSTKHCKQTREHIYPVCSDALRNDGNAPFVLYHGEATKRVAVLVHGLSDSPFFMQGIADVLYAQGFNVIVPLLPGHGLKDADADMEDDQLSERWQAHVADVMAIAPDFGEQVFLGGFSTGGALTVDYTLEHPDKVSAVMLFSGALALSGNAESLSKIWGIKWLAKIIDGDYQTDGPNPYKYPNVSSFAGLELMDLINHIRSKLDSGATLDMPVFIAHSQADNTTDISGVKNLLTHVTGSQTFFEIEESYNLCHADLVVNPKMRADMHFDVSRADPKEACGVPKANPLYRQMVLMLTAFVETNP